MKNFIKSACLAMLVSVIVSSCKKDASNASDTANADLSGNIAVGTLASTSLGTTSDSLYLVGCHSKNSRRDSVSFSALPAAVGTYLTANYAGYTFKKAWSIKDSLKAVTGYVVSITYNNNPVGLKFTTDGTFVKVLEQRAAGDLRGKGFHDGGPFNGRDGKNKDTIAISAIPTVVSTFFKTNYPTDTLLHASITRDTAYVLVSKNAGLFATVVSKSGTLIKRVQLELPGGKPIAVTQAALPAAITTYLTTTYPAYVFKKAFARTSKGAVLSYDVFITANSTNYAVRFDAAGKFVKASTLH